MSQQPAIRSKIEAIKKLIIEDSDNNQNTIPPAAEPVVLTRRQTLMQIQTCNNPCNKSQPMLQQPIILEKKNVSSKEQSKKKAKVEEIAQFSRTRAASTSRTALLKRVQEFEPIQIPQKENRTLNQPVIPIAPKACGEREIEIRIEKDEGDKECLKKLFKKITKLTDQLATTEKQRDKLKLQLELFADKDKKDKEDDKRLKELDLARHKLEMEVIGLKEKLAIEKARPPQVVEKVIQKPVEVIKQVPVEKIIEVKVEVPKYVPGPERVVQKMVEVPKYIEVEKKVPVEVIKTVVKEVPREIIKTVTVPEYIQKVVYVDKPIYVDKFVDKPVEVPIEVPIQVPVYIDRPVEINNNHAETELAIAHNRITRLTEDLNQLTRENEHQRMQIRELYTNIEILRRHNQEKNREVEALIQSSFEQYNSMPREIVKTVRVPEFVDRPVYVDRKVEVPIQVPVEVPLEVPVYRDSGFSGYQQESVLALKDQLNSLLVRNETLKKEVRGLEEQNNNLRQQNRELFRNIELLKKHHEEKNKEVEALIQHQAGDSGYLTRQRVVETRKYTTGQVENIGGRGSSFGDYSVSPDGNYTGRFRYE